MHKTPGVCLLNLFGQTNIPVAHDTVRHACPCIAALEANTLSVLGLGAVAGTASASIALPGTQLDQDEVFLLGVLGMGGAASLSGQLASTNVTDSMVHEVRPGAHEIARLMVGLAGFSLTT
jgi:hypothetical protein